MKRFLLIAFMFLVMPVIGNAANVTWYYEDSSTVYDTSTCTVNGDITLPTPPTKRGYTFVGWNGDKYKQIEYIASTGTQYINTGFNPDQNTRVVTEFMANTTNSTVWVFMTRIRGGSASYSFFFADNSQGTYEQTLKSDYNTSRMGNLRTTNYYNTKLKVDKNKNVTTVYDANTNAQITSMTHPSSSFSIYYNLLLFAGNDGGTPRYSTDGLRIYSTKIYNNGTLVRDMIPVLDSNGVPCMYDKVNDQFYYNAGTGSFTAGPTI